MTGFNPNDPGVANGGYFALPYKLEDSEIVVISAPWDVTTSYGAGTHKGPEAIIDASVQVDLFDSAVEKAWETRIGTHPIDEKIVKLNKRSRKIAEHVIEKLEEGVSARELSKELDEVNKASAILNDYVYETTKGYIEKGAITAVVGGEHSVPLGHYKALGEKYEEYGILHIDAHADLRVAYEGFTYSHASIMFNALNEVQQISQLTQVAVGDYCQQESVFIDNNPRIRCFTDRELARNSFEGKSWKKQCDEIISSLPENVYISLDIDGLSPEYCPGTGTPVPGGLSYNQLEYLLHSLALSSKKIIGFDLCEVSPSEESEWDANVGARLLYKLCLFTKLNRNREREVK